MKLNQSDYSNELIIKANNLLATRLFTFQRRAKTISTVDLAIDLSAEFGVEFYPNANDTITLQPQEFFKELYITAIAST